MSNEHPADQGYPCEDFELLCVGGVGGLIALIVVLAMVKSGFAPPDHGDKSVGSTHRLSAKGRPRMTARNRPGGPEGAKL
jgi:hypothetical protein